MAFNLTQLKKRLIGIANLLPSANFNLGRFKIFFAVKCLIYSKLSFIYQKNAREHFARNLSKAMPLLSEKEIYIISRKAWSSLNFSAVRLSVLKRLKSDKLKKYIVGSVEIEGREEFESACRDSQPIVFFTPHFGDFITGSMSLAIEGTKAKAFNVFYEKPDKVSGNAEFKPIIEELGLPANVLLNDKSGIIKVLRALKKGEALIMFSDLAQMSEGSFFVPFFDQLVMAMGGTAFFALKSNAKIIPFYCYPAGPMKSRLVIKRPLKQVKAESIGEQIYLLTKEIYADMEQQMSENPEHWRYWADWDGFCPVNNNIRISKDPDSWKENLHELINGYSEQQPEMYNFLKELQSRLT